MSQYSQGSLDYADDNSFQYESDYYEGDERMMTAKDRLSMQDKPNTDLAHSPFDVNKK